MIEPHRPDENLILAESETLLRHGRDVAASHLLEELLEFYPNSAKVLRALAQIRILQKRPQEAVPMLKRALELMKNPVSQATKIHNEAFGNDDAEYLEEESIKLAKRREYDQFSDSAIHNRTFPSSTPSAAGLREPNNPSTCLPEATDTFFEQIDLIPQGKSESTSSNLNLTFDTQNQETIHDLTLDDLLADEDNFVEQAIGQESGPIPDTEFEIDLALEPESGSELGVDVGDLPIGIEDEDNAWETPALLEGFDEESIWEGGIDQAEIDYLPTQQDLAEIPDRLTRAERALQFAIDVGNEFAWDRKGVSLLATIFNRYGWSAAKEAIRSEINSGMTPQELSLAEEVRQIWYQRTEFWSALNKFGEIVHRYSLISWPTSLAIIRSFKGYPQAEEVESLLESCFERWQGSYILQRRFTGFYSFALHCVGAYGGLPEHDGWIVFEEYSTDESDFDNDAYVDRQLELYGIKIDFHLNAFNRVIWEKTEVPDPAVDSMQPEKNKVKKSRDNSIEDEDDPC